MDSRQSEIQPDVVELAEDSAIDARPTVIDVEGVSMIFNMANQKLNSLKEYFIALLRHELMFKEFRALNDISFQVKKGDVFGILGTNGSGKSTLLKIISGVLTPSEGSVQVEGSIAPLIELASGFDMELTGRENIFLNGALLGHSRKYIEEHFDEIVDFAEIGDFLDMPLKNYSSGMVSRIAFAIATVMIPDILIVDEVLSVGDFMFQEKCEARIQDLIHNHNVTVLIVSHSIDQIERLCNKAIWIEKSRPRMMGNASDVAKVYRMVGGHKGSRSSEQAILDMMNLEIDAESIPRQTLASKSKYDTAIDILKKCEFNHPDTVVLTSGESTPDRIVSLGLAGALKAPLLFMSAKEIPERVRFMLEQYGPKKAVAVFSDSNLESEGIDELRLLMEHLSGSVDVISADDSTDLPKAVCDYLEGHDVTFSVFEPLPGKEWSLVLLSPQIYSDGLIADWTNYDRSDSFLSGDVTVEWNAHEGDDRISFADAKEVYEGHEWAEQNAQIADSAECVFVTAHDPSDALASAIYASQKNANLISMNHANLDSISKAIDAVEDISTPVGQLTFIGSSYCFNGNDKELLAKAACVANQKGSNAQSE